MIKLKRLSNVTDNGCPYRVFIDNKLYTTIKDGEEIGINIQKGDHTIQVKSHHFKSDILKFYFDSEELMSFTCYPMYTENKFSKVIYKLFSNKIGIALKKENDFYL